MDWLDEFISQLRALPASRQLALLVTTAGSLAFFAWLTFGAAAPEYRALYRGLPAEEASRVADALAADGIDFQVTDGGTSLLVASTQIAEARMRVAGRGLPGGSGEGFELFDEPAFGVTDFVHRINYVRAVQGELARSIEQLDPVDRARVQVVIPERQSVLSAVERKASASVVVGLRPNRSVDTDQVQAIVHLVASSIENLDPADVTVVDGSGRLLAPLDDMGGKLAGVGAGASSHKQRLEAELGGRIESIIEKTVGHGNVVARVNAVLDWSESETTEEIFDPEGQIARSEQRSTEASSEGSAEGVAGAVANIAGAAGPAGGGAGSSRTTETINYEISKKISRTVQPRGQVQRLSVAVLVADQPGATPEEATVPWNEESLALFEGLAREAVGLDDQRGDRITVSSAPFRTFTPDLSEPASFWPQWSPLLVALTRGLLVIVALFLFATQVVRPALEVLPNRTDASLPQRVADLEAALEEDDENPSAESMVANAIGAGDGPHDSVSIDDSLRAMRAMLNEG